MVPASVQSVLAPSATAGILPSHAAPHTMLAGHSGAVCIPGGLCLITTRIVLGAPFLRPSTVMLGREEALDDLIYLGHGAHYANGALGLLMLAGVVIGRWGWHVPEWLSGLIGVVLLLLALGDSLRHNRRQVV